jgi:GNAT superfamily N-acetyltransferase
MEGMRIHASAIGTFVVWGEADDVITVNIRPIREEDAAVAGALCTELGYPTDTAAVLGRMRQIAGDAYRAVLVACLDDEMVGWIDLSVEYHLQSEPAVLIGGLVVSESARGRGVGLQLCRAAEDWTRAQGVARMRVRSNAIRERAHAFYLRDGYAQVKTSAVFEKAL